MVQNTEIRLTAVNQEDYLCLTDMIKAKDGDFFVTDWLRNRNTLEYIGIWEKVYNPHFNYGEFATIKSQAGLNSFKISVGEALDGFNSPVRMKHGDIRVRHAVEMSGFHHGVVAHIVEDDNIIHLQRGIKGKIA